MADQLKRIFSIFVVFLLLIASPHHILGQEKLANPFGGQPPEFGPDFPDNAQITFEKWTGSVLGYERTFSFSTAEYSSGKYEWIGFVIHNQKNNEYCFIEPSIAVFKKNVFRTKPATGGCWLKKCGQGFCEFVRDLGGERYGSFECQRDIKSRVGKCIYTSISNGKKHAFSIRGSVE